MKIIFALPNMGSGGAERVVSILANQLITENVDIEIWLYYGQTFHYNLDSRIKTKCLNLLEHSKIKRVIILHKKLTENKKEFKDIVFVPFLGAIINMSVLANLGTGIPLVACERNNPYIHGTKWWQKFKAELPFLMANHCVFQTHDARIYYSHVPDRKVSIIINPISASEYSWEGYFGPSKLISICRLHKQKNLPLTLDVIDLLRNKIPQIHLNIYGEGELKKNIEEEIYSRGLEKHISLKGVTSNVPEKLSKSSIFLSTSDFEGISNSMLEAMSVGMPLICTDCPIGGAHLMLKNGAGILTPIKDAKKFAENLEELLNNPEKATKLGRKAKEVALSYTEEKITHIWLSLFNSLVK